jgi:hypothetical protein
MTNTVRLNTSSAPPANRARRSHCPCKCVSDALPVLEACSLSADSYAVGLAVLMVVLFHSERIKVVNTLAEELLSLKGSIHKDARKSNQLPSTPLTNGHAHQKMKQGMVHLLDATRRGYFAPYLMRLSAQHTGDHSAQIVKLDIPAQHFLALDRLGFDRAMPSRRNPELQRGQGGRRGDIHARRLLRQIGVEGL